MKFATLKNVEQHIIDCIRKNDTHAGIRLIVDHFHEQLYWAIRKLVMVHEDADDVLQLTYERIYKGLAPHLKVRCRLGAIASPIMRLCTF